MSEYREISATANSPNLKFLWLYVLEIRARTGQRDGRTDERSHFVKQLSTGRTIK